MGQYGQAALDAVQLLRTRLAQGPQEAWRQATISRFGNGTPSQEKSCPRGAFLGCCEDGLVRRVPAETYTRSRENKRYAVTAINLIKANPSLASLGERALWKRVLAHLKLPTDKAYNDQMDVVLTLFRNGLMV